MLSISHYTLLQATWLKSLKRVVTLSKSFQTFTEADTTMLFHSARGPAVVPNSNFRFQLQVRASQDCRMLLWA